MLYAVVIARNLTFDQATQEREASIAKGLPRTTRVWTAELPPGNIASGR
jgi:hypothetical protein